MIGVGWCPLRRNRRVPTSDRRASTLSSDMTQATFSAEMSIIFETTRGGSPHLVSRRITNIRYILDLSSHSLPTEMQDPTILSRIVVHHQWAPIWPHQRPGWSRIWSERAVQNLGAGFLVSFSILFLLFWYFVVKRHFCFLKNQFCKRVEAWLD